MGKKSPRKPFIQHKSKKPENNGQHVDTPGYYQRLLTLISNNPKVVFFLLVGTSILSLVLLSILIHGSTTGSDTDNHSHQNDTVELPCHLLGLKQFTAIQNKSGKSCVWPYKAVTSALSEEKSCKERESGLNNDTVELPCNLLGLNKFSPIQNKSGDTCVWSLEDVNSALSEKSCCHGKTYKLPNNG